MGIDAKEGRDFGIFDVLATYLIDNMAPSKFLVVKFDGRFVELMCETNPIYNTRRTYNMNKRYLYYTFKPQKPYIIV